jgi:hypothetical protein
LAFAPAAHAAAGRLDCSKIRDSQPASRFQATVTGTFGNQTCRVQGRAKLACVPADLTVSPALAAPGPQDSATGAFLCYPAKCPEPFVGSAQVEDELGRRSVAVKSQNMLCLPATVTPGPRSTSSTTLPNLSGCHFRDGRCEGTCPGGQKCGTTVSGASCECRPTPCGDAEAPDCNGACSSPGEACIFNLTGCSCVRVP